MLHRRIIYILLLLLGLSATAASAAKKFTLVIDAGHGGKDAGAPGKYSYEKTINLNVALSFGRYVERNCPDVKVVYTRKTDVFIPLHERAAIANRNKADVFVSIHTNSVASKKPVTGMETYTMGMRRSDEKLSAAMRENEVILIESNYKQNYAGFDPRSPESMIMFEFINENNMAESVEMAKLIQKNVCATAGRPNKGVKQDVFLVLRETSMPACLVELGYITTPSEEAYLNNPVNVDAMGRGLYQAFVAYKNKRTGGKAVAPAAPEPVNQPRQEPVSKPQAEPVSKPQQEPVSKPQLEPVSKPQAEPVSKPQPEPVVKKDTLPADTVLPKTSPAAPQTKSRQPKEGSNEPVFKVQLMSCSTKVSTRSPQMKGVTGVEYYEEGGMYKYTVGASTNYNEIYQLRKQLLDKFPQAFIIAFCNGKKMNTQEAYKLYLKNRKK